MLCFASLRLRLLTVCTGSRCVALVGFVAEKLSQMLDDLPVNLFSTELPFLWDREDILYCAVQVCNSSSLQCASVAEVRCLLDL